MTEGAALSGIQKILMSDPDATSDKGLADLLVVTLQACFTIHINPGGFARLSPKIDLHIPDAIELISNEAKEPRLLVTGNAIRF